jgi:hypothetical protein
MVMSAAIRTFGITSGNVITGNTVFRTAIFGIRPEGGASSEIVYNDIRDVCLKIDDCGAAYVWNTDGLVKEVGSKPTT